MNANSFQKPAGFSPQQQSIHVHQMLAALGMSPQQFSALSPQDRQIAGAKYMAAQQQHDRERIIMANAMPQQHFDRPSSSASSHSSMMPPPPPRPPTAQGMAMQPQQQSRPGTSMAHRSPTIPGSMQDMMQRPPSRMSQNGYKPQFNQPQQQSPFPTSSNNPPNPSSSPPASMGSPYRGAKRKLAAEMVPPMGMPNMNMGIPGSPRIGGGLGLSGLGGPTGHVMGPPSLPRSVSGDNFSGMGMNMNMNNMGGGMPNPMNGINNMNLNLPMNGQRQSPRPQSSMAMSSGIGGAMNMNMNNFNNMNMNLGNMGMNIDLPSRQPIQSSPTSQGLPQTPMRQGSLPPQSTPTPSSQMTPQHQQSMRQGSLPPGGRGGMPPTGPGMGMGMNMNMPGGAIGLNNMNSMGMNMNISLGNMPPNAPSSPNVGGPSGHQAMPMAPSLSGASSMGSMGSVVPPQIGAASGGMPTPGPGGMGPNPVVSGGTPGGPGNIQASLSTSNIGAPSIPGTSGGASITPGTPGSNAPGTTTTPATGPTPNGVGSGGSTLPSLNLNPSTTSITLVPLLTSTQSIPPLSPDEISQIKSWMSTDSAYTELLRTQQGRMLSEMQEAMSVGGVAGPMWWERGGNGVHGTNLNRWRRGREGFDVRYPRVRKDGEGRYSVHGGGRSGRKGLRREGLKLPRKIDPEDANRPEQLVPIRIEFDVEHHKMRDTFVWNLNDPVVTPEAFAQSLVEDYALAPSYHSVIVKSIQDQLSDFRAHCFSGEVDGSGDASFSHDDRADESDEEAAGLIKGTLDDENESARWWALWRKRVRVEGVRAVREFRAVVNGTLTEYVEEKEKRKAKRSVSKLRARKKRKAASASAAPAVKTEENETGEVEANGGGEDVSMLADNEFEGDDPEEGDEEEDEEDVMFKPLSLDEFKLDENAMHEDMRVLIKLDIIVGSVKLDDQFEWDLDNPLASPEEFAEVYTQELGLGGEFKTAIAHSIREQVQTYQKSLFLVGHPSDGTPVQDDELKQSFLPSLISGARPVGDVQQFTPLLNYLSDGELERTEKERDKDLIKRRKRNTRGRRGIALPDREPIRTYRTPAIGFPELDPATLALAAAANAPMSRRAAAAAASLTIANMVASENGTTFSPQPIPALPVVPQQLPGVGQGGGEKSKEKKPKGLFKPPSYPSSVLRPRAGVPAPTPSTAANTSGVPVVQPDNEAPPSVSSPTIPMATTSAMGGGSGSGQDVRANRVITAKRAKELEREAKEKEFVDGQHPNYIDGVWHCSNCGCPESIAVGRRKGPLGDKSQCGTCGKFWHRHRRPRPVEYNSDPDFHSGLKQKEMEASKTPAKKKGGAAAALRAQSAAHSAATPASEPQTPSRSNGDGMDVDRDRDRKSARDRDRDLKSPSPPEKEFSSRDREGRKEEEDDRAISPVSTVSSASEPPLAQRVKMNGTSTPSTPAGTSHLNHHAKPPGSSSGPAPPATPIKAEPPPSSSGAAGPSTPAIAPLSSSTPGAAPTPTGAPSSPHKTWPPQWLSSALAAMQARYPNDKFEVILRKVNASSTPEWRIKCLDCPGKLYTPGPGETLSNYDVHLKNRQHRQRVNERLTATAAAAAAAAAEAGDGAENS